MKKRDKPVYMSVRRYWFMNPLTRVKKSKKLYDRKLTKKEIKKILKSEDF
jgi:hypothetical protein